MRPVPTASRGTAWPLRVAKRLGGAFDPRGRQSRGAYRRLVPRLLLVAAGLVCAIVPLAASGARVPALILGGGLPILAALALTRTIRRFHDRGRSGWWLAPNLAIWTASHVRIEAAPIEAWADRYPLPVLAYVLATSGFTLWCLVEALGRSGTPGPNRYGAPPPATGP